ncbi:MAG: hypothetical protein HRT87_04555 [Legionellales bacterium]|nr:hypothetical protein [Legionellales bacterium]
MLKLFLIYITTFLAIIISPSIYSDSNNDRRYTPSIELTGKLGYSSTKENQRNIARAGFVLPIFQKMDKFLAYFTAIGLMDTAKHIEGNIGIGYRYFINPAWILGEYAFYDIRKTSHNNILYQATIGMEALSKDIEIRANVYLPSKKRYQLNDYNIYHATYDSATNITNVGIRNKQIFEQALPGFDLEIGGSVYKIPRLEMFAAYYYFKSKDVGSVIGGRLRSKIRILDWVYLEGESNYDNKRKFTNYLGLNLQWNIGSRSLGKQSWSEKKMTQLPVRDIDIVHIEGSKNTKTADKNITGRTAVVLEDIDYSKDEIVTDGNVIIVDSIDKIEAIEKANNIKFDDIAIVNSKNINRIQTKGEIIAKAKSFEPANERNSNELQKTQGNNQDINDEKFEQEALEKSERIAELLDELSNTTDKNKELIEQIQMLEETISKLESQISDNQNKDLSSNDSQQEIEKTAQEDNSLQQKIKDQQEIIEDLNSQLTKLQKRTQKVKKRKTIITPRMRAEQNKKNIARFKNLQEKEKQAALDQNNPQLSVKEKAELANLKQRYGTAVKSNVRSTFDPKKVKSSTSPEELKKLKERLASVQQQKAKSIATGKNNAPNLKELKKQKKARARKNMGANALTERQKNYPWEFPKKSFLGGMKPVTERSVKIGLANEGRQIRTSDGIDAEIKFYQDYLADPLRPNDEKFVNPATELLKEALRIKYQ